jgi:hypothetical protein
MTTPRLTLHSDMLKVYLPTAEVTKNVALFDELDLIHQRNCAMTILKAISGRTDGWLWHPSVTMWVGNEQLLAHIAHAVNEEWAQQVASAKGETRQSMTSIVAKYWDEMRDLGFKIAEIKYQPADRPWWWGNKKFHRCERSALLRRNKDWYGQFFIKTPNDLCEMWPKATIKDDWIVGPEKPDGLFQIHKHPIFKAAKRMPDAEFAEHANKFHNLMPDSRTPITAREPIIDLLRVLHDRFHTKTVYKTHDHL